MSDNGTGWAVAIFGDSAKSGSWRTGSKTGAVAVFGDSTLDMRRGLASGHEVTVRALAGFGDVRINVPAGSRVETSGFGLFGSTRCDLPSDPADDGPVVRVKAWALFGDVKIG